MACFGECLPASEEHTSKELKEVSLRRKMDEERAFLEALPDDIRQTFITERDAVASVARAKGFTVSCLYVHVRWTVCVREVDNHHKQESFLSVPRATACIEYARKHTRTRTCTRLHTRTALSFFVSFSVSLSNTRVYPHAPHTRRQIYTRARTRTHISLCCHL